MNAAMIFVAASVIGIDIGWEPLPDGGHEYIIQIEPQMLERLRDGDNDLFSYLPSGLDIRQYRITVGTAKLPREPSLGELRRPSRNQQAIEGEERKVRDREAGTRDDRPGGAFEKLQEEPLEPEATDIGERQRKKETVQEPDLTLGNPAHQANLVPQELEPDPKIHPLPGGKHVSFNDNGRKSTNTTQKPALKSSEEPPDAAAPKTQSSAERAEPPKPWWPLMFTVVLLFASLGGNAFLGWVAWGERNRSRGLLEKLHTAAGSS